MKSVLLGLMIFLSVTVFSQNKEDAESNVRVDPKKPTVYLSYLCQDEKKIYLRMHNNTVWHIGVGAEKSYFPTKNQFSWATATKVMLSRTMKKCRYIITSKRMS